MTVKASNEPLRPHPTVTLKLVETHSGLCVSLWQHGRLLDVIKTHRVRRPYRQRDDVRRYLLRLLCCDVTNTNISFFCDQILYWFSRYAHAKKNMYTLYACKGTQTKPLQKIKKNIYINTGRHPKTCTHINRSMHIPAYTNTHTHKYCSFTPLPLLATPTPLIHLQILYKGMYYFMLQLYILLNFA